MLEFCGQEQCMIDGNGRVKLSAGELRNFKRHTDGDVILYCLPEGAIAVYPPAIWETMRGAEPDRASKAANSVVFRRSLRRFGAMSSGAVISNQGRITISPLFRDYASLQPNSEVFVIGCEIGVEIWNSERWREETQLIQQHISDKSVHEMDADLARDDAPD